MANETRYINELDLSAVDFEAAAYERGVDSANSSIKSGVAITSTFQLKSPAYAGLLVLPIYGVRFYVHA